MYLIYRTFYLFYLNQAVSEYIHNNDVMKDLKKSIFIIFLSHINTHLNL